MNHDKHVYRLPPCPSYDVEGMEKWLSDLAEKGLILTRDGFFAGIATFAQREPCRAKYRLEAAQKSTSMWADDGGEPDPEQVELSQRYAWEYVAKRGDFYIYRSFDPGARELNTDPDVQALALNAVKKRQRDSVVTLVLWMVVYPLVFLGSGILLTILRMQTWLFLLTGIFVLWMIGDEIRAFVSLRRLQKKLREYGSLQADKNWRRGAASYHGKRAAKLILAIALVCILLAKWGDSVLDKDKMQQDAYTAELPFATMRDFADSEITDYRMTMTGLHMGFNSLQAWSDLLAPQCIERNEHARITLADGRVLDGGYYVDYYEMRSPLLARLLAKEMYRMDRREKNFEPMDAPEMDVACDTLYTYRSTLHFPTVVLQNGSRVIRACFYQTSSTYQVPDGEWISIVAGSLEQPGA